LLTASEPIAIDDDEDDEFESAVMPAVSGSARLVFCAPSPPPADVVVEVPPKQRGVGRPLMVQGKLDHFLRGSSSSSSSASSASSWAPSQPDWVNPDAPNIRRLVEEFNAQRFADEPSSSSSSSSSMMGRSLPELSAETVDTWVYPSNVSYRDYQYHIVRRALSYNVLVALPTGLQTRWPV
jgi:hypothetical protein